MSFVKSRKDDSISYLSKRAVDELFSIQEQNGLAKEVATGKLIAQKLHCRDRKDIAFAIRVMEDDIASLCGKPEFLSFESMLSVIAIIVAIAAAIPSFRSVLQNDCSSALTYVGLAVEIAVFATLLLFQSVRQWACPRKRNGIAKQLEEAKDCLISFYYFGQDDVEVKCDNENICESRKCDEEPGDKRGASSGLLQ